MARAVHGLECECFILVLNRGDEHVVAVFIPVARSLPQCAVYKLRSAHFLVTVACLGAAHVILQRGIKPPAFGVPEHLPHGFFLKMEQAHFLADPAMIALFCFFQLVQVRIQFLLIAPCRAVHTGEHGVTMVPTPISACHLHQLESSANILGGAQMWTTAQIQPFTLPIDGNFFIFRQIANQLGFKLFTALFKKADRIIALPDFTHKRLSLGDNFAHFGFNGRKVFRGERFRTIEIVIEAVFNGRTDCNLSAGV